MIFGIISYHRLERQRTLKYLVENGVPKENIILSVNDKNDLISYTEKYRQYATIIYREKHNAAGNRNTILNHVGIGKRLVLMDDDVKGIAKWVPDGGTHGKMVRTSFTEFIEALNIGFDVLEAFGSKIFGFYPTGNSMFIHQTLQSDGIYSFDKLFQGGCVGIITSENRFDERIPVCDDYDFIINQISRKRTVIRINNFTALKEKDFSTKGGCYEAYKNGAQKKALIMIAKKYPKIVSVKKDYTGLRLKREGNK